MFVRRLVAVGIAVFALMCGPGYAASESTALGLRVAPFEYDDPRFNPVEVTGVLAYSPAWRVGVMVGDVLDKEADWIASYGSREALRGRDGVRNVLVNRVELTPERTVKPNGRREALMMREQFYLPGEWIEERITREAYVARGFSAAQSDEIAAFFRDAKREIATIPCQGQRLSRARAVKTRFDELANIADGFRLGGWGEGSQALFVVRASRETECLNEGSTDFVAARVAAFEIARQTPSAAIVEVEALGVRLREVEATFGPRGPRRLLQIQAVREFSPIWRARDLKPGDFLDTTLRSLDERVARRLRLGPFATITLQTVPLTAQRFQPVQVGTTLIVTQSDGRWLDDALSVAQRATSDPVYRQIAARFDDEVEAALSTARMAGCAAQPAALAMAEARLDDLARAAGREMPLGIGSRLRRVAEAACFRQDADQGPDDALYEAIAAMRTRDCTALSDLSAASDAVRDNLTDRNFDSYTATSLRLFLRDGTPDVKTCVIDFIAERFHAGAR